MLQMTLTRHFIALMESSQDSMFWSCSNRIVGGLDAVDVCSVDLILTLSNG